ncbi:hypothetical protein JJB11_21380 [Ramlibacter ginsenosidimutans]|uniref:Uncharacterized protein n=1 Tax=Ramlibacter ginsenosidimutans TaxID=502333 RepID=A0A934WPJ7_9BURK|nr:hypothetical protein [Ramlibacter ginsenosidimutans]MBK6008661.1 hypothetical protein [Ramlibacter ginsenosidimutans]
MTLKPESKYPNRRSYVLKMRSDATPGELAGRIENLVTGQQREFASGGELLASIARDLESAPDGDAKTTLP